MLEKRKSLQEVLPEALSQVKEQDKAWLHEMVYGVLRQLPTLQFWLSGLLQSSIKHDSRIVEHLLYLGIYQLQFSRVSEYAAVSETVNACGALKQAHLKKLVNAVLRNFIRNNTGDSVPQDERIALNWPKWYFKKIKSAYPDDYLEIAQQQNSKPPIWLRINVTKINRQNFITHLDEADIQFRVDENLPEAVQLLESTPVTQLPGYQQGWFSVQDKAAQHAAVYLNAMPGDSVLDACAAPGGKYCHIIESQPRLISCVALEVDAKRAQSISENAQRLGLENTDVRVADAINVQDWNPDEDLFDKILLDAPCSATGIIRRHPDILWLRKTQDIAQLTALQSQILDTLWQQLKPGGELLYATCSILPEENCHQIAAFLARTPDASAIALQSGTHETERQILPGQSGMDGFYYAKLQKQSVTQ